MSALIQQLDECPQAINNAVVILRQRMQGVLEALSVLPIPSSAIASGVASFNEEMVKLEEKQKALGVSLEPPRVTCSAILTIRQAGTLWLNEVVPGYCNPLVENLNRSAMEMEFSWKSMAVEDYLNHVDRGNRAAVALGSLGKQIGESLLELADAIDKQNTVLSRAMVETVASVISAVGTVVSLGAAIGAVVGSTTGGGVGAIPGAAIGAVVSAVIMLIAAVIFAMIAIDEWREASRVVSDAGATQLRRLLSEASSTKSDSWPDTYRFFDGSDFQKR